MMMTRHRNGFRQTGVIFCALLKFAVMACAGTYSGGAGTAEDPYKISSVADWQELIASSADWDKHFVLTDDLDFAGQVITPVAPDMDEVSGFQGPAFTGFVDGKGHTISGLTRHNCWWDDEIGTVCNGEYVGLFGKNLGTIQNLGLLDCTIDGGRCVGCLAAENGGTIRNCFSTGSASGGDIVGGLVGFNDFGGMIVNSYSKVTVWGRFAVGGLAGVFVGETISNCYSTGPAGGYAYYYGGLVGDCNAYLNILNSFWDTQTSGEPQGGGGGTGKTTAQMKTLSTFTDAGWDFAYSDGNAPVWKMPVNDYPKLFWEYRYSGGSGTVEDPYKISSVADWQELIASSADWDKHFILLNDIDFGGINLTPVAPDTNNQQSDFQGTAFQGVFQGHGHVLWNVVIKPHSWHYVGLFGYIGSGGLIEDIAIDNISIQSISGAGAVGGLAGVNEGTITSCHLKNSVIGPAGSSVGYAGGLVGENIGAGRITGCSVAGTITGVYYIGGLVGYNEGEIVSCYTANVVTGDIGVGGLVGFNEPISHNRVVADCHSISSVSGSEKVGGLIGGIASGTVSGCHAMGTVNGNRRVGGLVGDSTSAMIICCNAIGSVRGDIGVGGLVGVNHGDSTITSSYATGTVAGIGNVDEYLGGLAGVNSGTISSCYSTGAVTGQDGGLCGYDNWGTIIESFWDIETSGQSTSAGGEGKTTAEMKAIATFTDAGWDFVGESANGTADVWRMCVDGVDYPRLSWEFSGGGDFACPDGVAMEDLLYLAGRWTASIPSGVGAADVDGDGKVGLTDFAILGENWMK